MTTMTATKNKPVRVVRRDGVAAIVLNNPPVNALGREVRAALLDALRQVRDDDRVKAAALTGAGKTFCAGADIREFASPPSPPLLPEVAALMDEINKPLAAVIRGAALGGGLELALCCHYRAAFPDAKLGLPEVNLGVIPGAGGTQRLPRLVGAEVALEMIPAGKIVDAQKALALGIVDRVFPKAPTGTREFPESPEPESPESPGFPESPKSEQSESPEEVALQFAQELSDSHSPVRRVSEMPVAEYDPDIFARRRAQLTKRDPGAFAPFRCADAVECAATLPFAEGVKREREMFLACLKTPQRAGLVHAFFAEKRAVKIVGAKRKSGAGETDKEREVKTAAVIGGGRMGAGIAWCLAAAGIPVRMLEASPEALSAGLARARAFGTDAVRRGRMRESDAAKRGEMISGASDFGELSAADLAIEAATEDLDLKRDIFAELNRARKPDAIVATNTSSLDINEMAAFVSRPENFVGMHFFNPAPAMKLLEIARARTTSDATATAAMRVGKTLGKIPVAVGACRGFAGNRMAFAYGREAEFLAEEGAAPEQVDRVLREFGMAMGPLETRDLAGIDNGWNIRRDLWRDLPPDFPRPGALDALYRAGRFGRKSGAGYYRYDSAGGAPLPDPETTRILEEVAAARGIVRRPPDDDEILARCLFALVNEGAKILEEKIAARAGDLDVINIRGFGFPARRGGPMFWADGEGLPQILSRVRAFHQARGAWWTPAPLLIRLAESGGKFSESD